MRDHLIGFLLDALEPAEHEQVEAQLRRDPQLQRDLELLARSLLPLASDRAHFDPPMGLAHRTCLFVTEQAAPVSVPITAPEYVPPRWSFTDMLVAAGIFIAAALLFFPAMSQSQFAARVTGCQNNLRQLGMAMNTYSMMHGGFFPDVPRDGQLAAAGVVAVRLREMGMLDDPQVVLCPGSEMADERDYRMPTFSEMRRAAGPQLIVLHRKAGGSLGYNVGFMANGKYQSAKNRHRARYAIVADAPSPEPPYQSYNHGGCGQNVLFEDQHVQYLTTCRAHGCRDDFYTNDNGVVGLGLHENDAVLVPSDARPQLESMLIDIRKEAAE
jgi:hypothetical protein